MENKTHWLQSPNKNYLGHWDLPEEGITLTIDSAKWEVIENPKIGTKEEKRIIRWVEGYKPLICNQTNAQMILKSTGIKYMEDAKGCKVFLSIGQARYMGDMLDCIRIKPKPIPQVDPELKRVLQFIESAKKELSVPKLIAIEKNLVDNGKDTPEYLQLIESAKGYIIDQKMNEDEI